MKHELSVEVNHVALGEPWDSLQTVLKSISMCHWKNNKAKSKKVQKKLHMWFPVKLWITQAISWPACVVRALIYADSEEQHRTAPHLPTHCCAQPLHTPPPSSSPYWEVWCGRLNIQETPKAILQLKLTVLIHYSQSSQDLVNFNPTTCFHF